MLDLPNYDAIIVAFSGGKDSLACVLHLLEMGVEKSRIELWHHLVDGAGEQFMDWHCTEGYCKAVAKALGIPIYMSYLEGGFLREMMRDGTAKAPTHFETPTGWQVAGGKGKPGTRLKFPQVSADLSVRWCSSYLKIDVASVALNNDTRFIGKNILFVTGERAEESPGRAKYADSEEHRTHSKRKTVHHWRPILRWGEQEVWDIMGRWRINPHPAYQLGFNRVSCMTCIFMSMHQAATVKQIASGAIDRLVELEHQFGSTIKRPTGKSPVMMDLEHFLSKGTPYQNLDPAVVNQALSTEWYEPIFVENWQLPAGAFGESTGPT